MKPKILVIGAVGKTGKEVPFGLLAKGFPVRAFVRIDDYRAQKLRQAGAEIFRTLANKLRTLTNFGKILVTPTPDLDRYEKDQSHVLLREPKFGLDYAPWATTHNVDNAFGWATPSTPQLPKVSEFNSQLPTIN